MKQQRKYVVVLEWYDEEEHLGVQQYYWISDRGYIYRQTALSNGETLPAKRITEKELESAIETYHNA